MYNDEIYMMIRKQTVDIESGYSDIYILQI